MGHRDPFKEIEVISKKLKCRKEMVDKKQNAKGEVYSVQHTCDFDTGGYHNSSISTIWNKMKYDPKQRGMISTDEFDSVIVSILIATRRKKGQLGCYQVSPIEAADIPIKYQFTHTFGDFCFYRYWGGEVVPVTLKHIETFIGRWINEVKDV